MAIVDKALRATAHRNERGVAVARLIIAVAFVLRLLLVMRPQLFAGEPRAWTMFLGMVLAGAASGVFLVGVGSGRFSTWQRTFVGLDLLLVAISMFPSVLWPWSDYGGLLLSPFAAVATLVSVAGGLRLDRFLAFFTSIGTLLLFAIALIVDVSLNGARVQWALPEVLYFAIEIGGAGVVGVLVASRTLDLATRSASKAIEAERAREHLGAYVGKEVAEEALRVDEIVLGGARQPVAVLFSDLRGFTSYAEKLSPEALVTQLNAYLEEMVAVITRHGGVVDKYIGDGIMAVFGAPRSRGDDARRAIACAKDLVKALESHNARRALSSLPPLKMGIGVHYGAVVAGNIGTLEHAQYTIIGDTVNLASRLESSTKDLGTDVLVSAAAKAAANLGIDDEPKLLPMGMLAVRGRGEAVEVFGLEGRVPAL
ncbi:MAG TPA: adenylate/guanylate cyclase domain-containing protein, partial [Myxococcota bacterium]